MYMNTPIKRPTVAQVVEHNKYLSDMINDLTLSLEMWIDGYPFDNNHIIKQKIMINNACLLIGKPRTIEELKNMMGV